jgi:membrane protein implicated in regulation of membrane protease activity
MNGILQSLAETPAGWLALAAILAALEIIMPGVFLIWIAAAAAVTGALSFLLPIGTAAQLILFAILCGLSVYFGRRWYLNRPVPSSDPLLNDRAARLVGERVEVVEAIHNGSGRVKVGDSIWTARGADAPVGSIVRITGAVGSELLVEPIT